MNFQPVTSLSVLLLGDSCHDVYHYGECRRLSPEAPVPVFSEDNVEVRGGMALNVYHNLLAHGVDVECLVGDADVQKHRYVDLKSRQHLLRVDRNDDTGSNIFRFDSRIFQDINVVVLSDYNKGYLTPGECEQLSRYCFENNIPIFVDSKKTDLSCFENCILKINKGEYEKVSQYPEKYDLIVTLGSDGTLYKGEIYNTKEVEVFDVCGAGDVFLASLVYMYMKHGDMIRSIEFANKCAAYSVTKFGTYVLTEGDINDLCV
jgi:bifunctional ADP-heptose synthase (sugar kinase/adenylyltransferase)